MLLPTLEWLVALLMLETLSDECCLRMRRSVAWEVPFPGDPRSKTSAVADFAPSSAPGFTPTFAHPRTSSYLPLDLTCWSWMLPLRSLSRWGPCPFWLIKGELFSLCPTEVRGGSGRTPPHLLSWALDTTMCPQVAAIVNCVVSAPSLPLSAPAAPAFSCPWMDMLCPYPFTAWQLLFFLPGMLFSLCSAWPALINPSHVTPSLTFPGGLPSELTVVPEITSPPKAVRPK